MFCSKCGSEVPANSKFCPKCGAPTPQQAAPQPQPAPAPASGPAPGPTPGSAPISQPKKISTKAVGIGIGVIAVIVVAVVLFGVFGVFGGGKPEDVARQYIEAQLNGDADKVYSLISPDVFDAMVENYYDGDEDELRDMVDDTYSSLEDMYADMYGEGWTYEIEVDEADEFDRDEVDDVEKNFEDIYDSEIKLDGAAEVDVNVTFKDADGEEQDDYDYVVRLVKQGGKWRTTAL